jgi:hypothetical protein
MSKVGYKKPPKEYQWKKGQSGNINGRPKGKTIKELVIEAMETKPEGSDKTYKELYINKLLNRALINNDSKLMISIWNHLDGMPRQKIESDVTLNKTLGQLIDELDGINKEPKTETSK